MASDMISGRSKELDASTSASESVSLLRTMSSTMSGEDRQRHLEGQRGAGDCGGDPSLLVVEDIETMAIEALKVQAGIAEEQGPIDVSTATENPAAGHPRDNAVPPEECAIACTGVDAVTMLVEAQLRDPMRRYEAGRAATCVDGEPRFKVANMHVGGLRLKSADRRNVWDGERQRLTASHWLVAYGLGKASKKGRAAATAKTRHEVLWSMLSRVVADMWLKPMRNPDVKIADK